MGFDSQKGHNHWHFEQFARYTLLNSTKSVAVTSHKGRILPSCPRTRSTCCCAAPCGSHPRPARRACVAHRRRCGWQKEMPVGWGDTYYQVAGQSFDITHVPNGTYYIEVTAQPAAGPARNHHPATTVSVRKVILGGTAGHRTVKVPAWHGIDPEH